jgi:hypothetical protein
MFFEDSYDSDFGLIFDCHRALRDGAAIRGCAQKSWHTRTATNLAAFKQRGSNIVSCRHLGSVLPIKISSAT